MWIYFKEMPRTVKALYLVKCKTYHHFDFDPFHKNHTYLFSKISIIFQSINFFDSEIIPNLRASMVFLFKIQFYAALCKRILKGNPSFCFPFDL